MHSAVLILPIEYKEQGDFIAAIMGWGEECYSIPVFIEGSGEQTHIGLRADVQTSFIELINAAKLGHYPPEIPENIIAPVIDALIFDFSPSLADNDKPILWGAAHMDAVCKENNMVWNTAR